MGFRNIWTLITGVDQEVTQVNSKLDGFVTMLDSLMKGQVAAQKTLNQVYDTIQDVQDRLAPPLPAALEISISGTIQGENGMQQVKDDGSVVFKLKITDKKGQPTNFETPAVWTSSDESIATLNASPDGLTAIGVLTGKLGTFSAHAEGQSEGAALGLDSELVEVDPGAPAFLEMEVAPQAAPAEATPSS